MTKEHRELKKAGWQPLARKVAGRFALLALCTGIFALVLTLHGVPASPALYAGALCAVPLLIVAVMDIFRLRERHQTLARLANGLPETLDYLPLPRQPLEADYQRLLRDMAQLHARHIGENDLRYRQMTDYYTMWSHQIKTPLAAMGLLLRGQDDARGRLLMAEVQKTEHYVDMAINFMRLDSSDSDYRFEPVRLKDAAQAAARRYAGQFVLKRLSLSNDVPENATATSDKKWLVFVLEQLLSNAVKYTQSGGVSVTWDERTQTLSVNDTGIGIAADDLPRVFEQGFTGYTGRMEQQATGIGLFLCKKACNRLGHDLNLISSPGQGTSAAITFHPNTFQPE